MFYVLKQTCPTNKNFKASTCLAIKNLSDMTHYLKHFTTQLRSLNVNIQILVEVLNIKHFI